MTRLRISSPDVNRRRKKSRKSRSEQQEENEDADDEGNTGKSQGDLRPVCLLPEKVEEQEIIVQLPTRRPINQLAPEEG